ncbi:MAG: hypothetical protein ACPGRD_01725 [Planktomarina sp.]
MRNAALTLGLIGSLIGLIIGFFSFGYTEIAAEHGEVADLIGNFDNVQLVRWASVLGPILGIAGAAMARSRALWGGIGMLASAALMYAAFGMNLFTTFPIAMVALAGVLALAAGRPDKEHSHF